METAFHHQADDAVLRKSFQSDLMRLANSPPECGIPPLSPSGSNSGAPLRPCVISSSNRMLHQQHYGSFTDMLPVKKEQLQHQQHQPYLEEAGAAHRPHPSHHSDETHTSCSNAEDAPVSQAPLYGSDNYNPGPGRYCGAGGVDPHTAMGPPMQRPPMNSRHAHPSSQRSDYGNCFNGMQQQMGGGSGGRNWAAGPNGGMMGGGYGQQPPALFSSPFATRQASCHLPEQDLHKQSARCVGGCVGGGGLLPDDVVVPEDFNQDDDSMDEMLRFAAGDDDEGVPEDLATQAWSFPSRQPQHYTHMGPPPVPVGRFASGHMRHPRFHNGSGDFGHPGMMMPQQRPHQQPQQQHNGYPNGYANDGGQFAHPSMLEHAYLASPPSSEGLPHDLRTMSAPVLQPPPTFDSFIPVNPAANHNSNSIFAESPTKRKAASMLVNPRQAPSPASTPGRAGSGGLGGLPLALQQQLLLTQQSLPPSPAAAAAVTPRSGGGLPPRSSPATTPRGNGAGVSSQGVSPGTVTPPRGAGIGGGLPPISPASTPRGGVGGVCVPALLPSASPARTPRVSQQSFLGGSFSVDRVNCSSSSFLSGELTDGSCAGGDDDGLDPSSKTTLDMLGDLEPSLVPLLAQKAARKGKGGRSPALDPRLDPEVDPKKAKRILANRMSAAKSKLKQKLMMEGLRAKHEVLKKHKDSHQQELEELRRLCGDLEAKNLALQAKVQTLDGTAAPAATTAPSTPTSLGSLFRSPAGTPGGGGALAGGGDVALLSGEPDYSLLLPGVPEALFDGGHVSDNFLRTSDGGLDPGDVFDF